MFRANNFDKLLDKATSNLRLDPDWPTILQICDLIRQNDCTPKYAVAAIKKKLYSPNPHQAMFALLTLESVVKNCGSGIHDEVASKVFCEMLRDLVKTTQHENLRTKILELIQAWGFAFRNNPKYRAVQDTVNILKAEGYKFPTLKESDAMFSADTAPEWADGEVCHRCRVAFSLMVRRHHCRACGQVFCQQCSSKNSTLPKFGIEKEVRVCDACYDKVSRPPSSAAKLEIVDTTSDYGPTAAQPQKRPGKTAEELQEEEELQLALALSQSEADHKEKERRTRTHVAPEPATHLTVSPTPSSVSASPEHAPTTAELSRYLDRNYWEQRLTRDSNAPTAPTSHTQSDVSDDYAKTATSKPQDDDNEDKEIDEFVETLKSQVEIFVNRMKSNSSRGRSIANDTSVQSLFMNITAMHSQLLRYIQQQDDKRVYLESLQDKINQIRDSRAALDTLRAEHAARVAAAAEAAERQRQMQMAAKLQAMRKKKHEYLQYQRQLALQRVQEQEREMQMRQEQQKHQYMMAAGTGYYMPGAAAAQYAPGYPAQPLYAAPPFHAQAPPPPAADGQPQLSQPNLPMNANQMGVMSQSMPQLPNTFPMSTSGVTLGQAPMASQPSMNPQIRPNPSQHMQQQIILHQMRMAQPGVHQILPQGVNGMPGQNVPLQNGQIQQLPKQLPNQQQQPPTSMMSAMSIGQMNMSQPQMTQANPMLGMQMQGMRMPMMQGQNPQGVVSGYQLSQPSNPAQQQPNMQQQSQIPGQPMSLPGQQIMQQGQNQSMAQGQIPPNSQNLPQMQPSHHMPQLAQQQNLAQGQQMSLPGQHMKPPGQQINMQGQQMQPQGQGIPQPSQQLLNQGHPMQMGHLGQHNQQMMQGQVPQQMQMGQVPQQMPSQGQQIPSQGQQIPSQGQQIPSQGQQIPQGQSMPQMQPISQGQPIHQAQSMPQGQPIHQAQSMPQGQPIHQAQPMLQGQVHQIPQGQPLPQGQQIPQGQSLPQGQQPMQQQMPQGQQMPQNNQGQPMKMPSQNFSNGPSAAQPPPPQPPNQAQPPGPPPPQPPQAPVKAEHKNNTAELISFD